MKDKVEMNFSPAAVAVPLRISNSNGDIVIVSVDPETQHFNITKEGSPIINFTGDAVGIVKINKNTFS